MNANLVSPSVYIGDSWQKHQAYAMTDGVSPEQFDAALEEAKVEGDLSRADVVRKVRGEAMPPFCFLSGCSGVRATKRGWGYWWLR